MEVEAAFVVTLLLLVVQGPLLDRFSLHSEPVPDGSDCELDLPEFSLASRRGTP